MRHLLALIVPPIVVLIWGKLRPIFLVVLRKSKITEYTDPILIEHVVSQTIEASKVVIDERKINLDSFRVFFALAMSPEKPTSVVDLGGAGGYHYFNAKVAFGKSALKWAVVETPEFCRYAKQSRELEEIYFTSSVTDAFNYFDNDVELFYSSRALQYLPNPLEILREACAMRPKYIFLSGLTFSPNGKSKKIKQHSSLASNGPQVRNVVTKQATVNYELQLLSQSAVDEIILENFVILYKTVEEPRVHKLKSLIIPYSGIYAVRKDIFSQVNP